MRTLSKPLLAAVLVIILASCRSTSQFAPVAANNIQDITATITFANNNLQVPVSDFIKEVGLRSTNSIDDIATTRFQNELNDKGLVSKNTIILNRPINCSTDLEKAQASFFDNIQTQRWFTYKLVQNTATGTNLHPQKTQIVSQVLENNNVVGYSVESKFTFNYGEAVDPAVGIGRLSLRSQWSCSEQSNTVTLRLSATEAQTANPIVDLGFTQDMAEISLNRKNGFDFTGINRVIYDSQIDYLRLTNAAISSLDTRFNHIPQTYTVNEYQIELPHQVLVSRVQREMTDLAYRKNVTLFVSRDSFLFNNKSSSITTRFKVYPEINDSTRVLIESDYTQVVDTFSRQTTFGEQQANNVTQPLLSSFLSAVDAPSTKVR